MSLRTRWQGASAKTKTATTGVVAAGVLAAGAIAGPMACGPEGSLKVDARTIPPRRTGTAEATWTGPDGAPYISDEQAKIRISCEESHQEFSDAIVYPGKKGAAHLHRFFGNTSLDAYTTAENIRAEGHKSTCEGGSTNLTGYWAPSLVDRTSRRVINGAPVGFRDPLQVYYHQSFRGVANESMRWFPDGLRMIAGGTTGASQHAWWNCLPAGNPRADATSARHATIQETGCRPGQYLQAVIEFPQCWDGRNLDSADHRSHMAYGEGWRSNPDPPVTGCPPSHPVPLPEVLEFVRWWLPVPGTPVNLADPDCDGWPDFNPYDEGWGNRRYDVGDGCELMPDYDVADLALSSDGFIEAETTAPGGTTLHADWFNGWDPVVGQQIIDRCINPGRDCGLGLIPPENWNPARPYDGVRKLGPAQG